MTAGLPEAHACYLASQFFAQSIACPLSGARHSGSRVLNLYVIPVLLLFFIYVREEISPCPDLACAK